MSVLLLNAALRGRDVELTWTDARPKLTVPLLWLRDHCESALHPETRQRIADTFAIPADLGAKALSVIEGGRALCIEWRPGTHVSRYEAAFLAGLRADPEVLPVQRRTWEGPRIAERVPQVEYDDVMASDVTLKQFLEELERWGLCFVEEVPATPEATRAVAERVAYIRQTIFGGYYDFTANLEQKDTAYTSLAIGPHTDGTYSFDAPGYQMFHCLAAECIGGENVLIDGFRIAEIMQEHHADDYDILTRVEVPGQYLDHARGIHLVARRPLFRLNGSGDLVQVSYNNHDRAPFILDADQHDKFYRALRTFARLCSDPALQYRRRLLPGSLLLFDNWRLLHARDAYTGYRRLAGAYLNKEDVESRLRVLRLKAGESV